MSDWDIGHEEVRELTAAWWLMMLLGVMSVVAGLVVLAKPSHSLTTLAVVFGVFVLIDSIYELVSSLFARGGGGVLVGAFGTVVGILLIRHPMHGVMGIGLLIGLWFVAVGVIRLMRAFALKSRGWNLAVALLELAAGIVIVASPHVRFATLAALVGISLILNGLVTAGLGWSMHALRRAAASATPRAGLGA